MGGCQNYGPFLGALNIRCRIIIGTQKGITILTTTHIIPIYPYIPLKRFLTGGCLGSHHSFGKGAFLLQRAEIGFT